MKDLIKQIKEHISETVAVSKMEKQLTDKECENLLSRYMLIDIKNQISKMDNWKPLLKKNRSVYSTVVKWFEMDEQRGIRYNKPSTSKLVVAKQKNKLLMPMPEEDEIPAEWQDKLNKLKK